MSIYKTFNKINSYQLMTLNVCFPQPLTECYLRNLQSTQEGRSTACVNMYFSLGI